MPEEQDDRRICVTLGQRVTLGNYERAELSVCLSGIPAGATEADIEEMLDTSHIAYKLIRERLKERVSEIRTESAQEQAAARSQPYPKGETS